MESLLTHPIYKYKIQTSSHICYLHWYNCCFISSFQIQMKNLFSDFPNLGELLELLYPDTSDAYTHFITDFPIKWSKLKEYLIMKDPKWSKILSRILLRICLPIDPINKTRLNQCVLLNFIDLNLIDTEEIKKGKYESLEQAMSTEYSNYHIILNIIQFPNHFEPINIIENVGILEDTKLLNRIYNFLS